MVEYNASLDSVFTSLSDPTRRAILMRVSQGELSVGELAKPFDMSFAAVSKHIAMLEDAHLVRKRKVGKQQLVTASMAMIETARETLQQYEKLWNTRFEQLDRVLDSTK